MNTIDKMTRDLRNKYKKAQLERNKERLEFKRQLYKTRHDEMKESDTSFNENMFIKKQPPTAADAEKALLLRKELQTKFKQEKMDMMNDVYTREKAFEPVTKKLNEVVHAVKQTDTDLSKRLDLVPLKKKFERRDSDFVHNFEPKATSSPHSVKETPLIDLDNSINLRENKHLFDSDEKPESFLDEESEPFLVQLNDLNRDQTMLKLVENPTHSSSVGPKGIGVIAKNYILFPDKQFGIYPAEKDILYIGNKKVVINDNNIFIEDKKYEGTHGLWKLLTKTKSYPDEKEYTKKDMENYTDILIQTSSMLQRNDPNTRFPKSSQNEKWTNIVRKIWAEQRKKGEGLIKYSEKSVPLISKNYGEILKRLNLIAGEEEAGNNNTSNEKLSLLDTMYEDLKDNINKPESTKILAIFADILSKSIKGEGVFNYLLNNFNMPEMHLPGYNFCGPFTKLDERLARGDKGINELDEACKRHDIFYRDHKDVQSRHIGDKVLEDEADKIVHSSNTSMKEKTDAFIVKNAMRAKRMFGLGINHDICY